MSIEKPANERLNLYNRFKESLKSGDDSTFYDADDLIIIIDQAVDLEDEYTEIEAIMRGYRFFPDNEELAARRAFLYYDLNLDEGVDNMRGQLTADSPMNQILQIRRLEEVPENQDVIIRLLNEIVDMPGLLDDEEIIQLVDCAGSTMNYDWLKQNEDKLRTKTDYLPTLLYEMFIVSDMFGDREYSLKLLEELTELQPFNIDFWNAIAQVQAYDGDNEADFDAALNSVEFALAIDSENADALTLKASILLRKERFDECVNTLRPIADNLPTAIAAQIHICALINSGHPDEGAELLNKYCRKFPDSSELVDLAITAGTPQIGEILGNFFESGRKDETETIRHWHKWADNLYRDGRLRAAITVFQFMHDHDVLNPEGYRRLFTALYAIGEYDRCIELYDQLGRTQPNFLITEMILAMLMSYMRKGNKAAAKRAFKAVNERLPMNMTESWTMSTAIESIGMSNFMAAVKSIIDGRGAMQPDFIDIFELPYQNKE
ncbi:MAG: hypothetical protein NC301_05635 [Bacteroides sp.]|nr:hypothetical protein [Bacteroides sp.]MCM1379246.1 hypothetical protein [Bacteroides sp.]MCM1445096.1 hypothetical protein [Prevotella sp.]